jgi:two-component system sensor histidine kinase SenX3
VALVIEDLTEATRVEAVRRDFVANVSHELKTPVGALQLLAEAIGDGADDPKAVRNFATRISREATRLGRLVQELIDLSRLQGAEPSEAPVVTPMEKAVGEALDRTRLAASAKHITVAVVTEPGPPLLVLGAERQLATAVANLLENAVHYSPERTRVIVGLRRRDDVVEVSVADEGIGIAEQDLERVFERFYRADPARSRATGGTGLGLAIVKHIATNHGGEATVWSAPGKGSTFTLRLPAHGPLPDPAPETAPEPVPERETP